MIPAEAVEAAAKMYDAIAYGGDWELLNDYQKESRRRDAELILEAAAPYIVAAALREAADHLEYGNPINDWLYERADEIAPTDAV